MYPPDAVKAIVARRVSGFTASPPVPTRTSRAGLSAATRRQLDSQQGKIFSGTAAQPYRFLREQRQVEGEGEGRSTRDAEIALLGAVEWIAVAVRNAALSVLLM